MQQTIAGHDAAVAGRRARGIRRVRVDRRRGVRGRTGETGEWGTDATVFGGESARGGVREGEEGRGVRGGAEASGRRRDVG